MACLVEMVYIGRNRNHHVMTHSHIATVCRRPDQDCSVGRHIVEHGSRRKLSGKKIPGSNDAPLPSCTPSQDLP